MPEIFSAAGRSFGSLECAVCTLEKKICAGCKNADVCRGPAEIKKKKKRRKIEKKRKRKALALQCRICEVLVCCGNVGRAHFICLFLLTYCPPDSCSLTSQQEALLLRNRVMGCQGTGAEGWKWGSGVRVPGRWGRGHFHEE